jgi:hypothetical protein
LVSPAKPWTRCACWLALATTNARSVEYSGASCTNRSQSLQGRAVMRLWRAACGSSIVAVGWQEHAHSCKGTHSCSSGLTALRGAVPAQFHLMPVQYTKWSRDMRRLHGVLQPWLCLRSQVACMHAAEATPDHALRRTTHAASFPGSEAWCAYKHTHVHVPALPRPNTHCAVLLGCCCCCCICVCTDTQQHT